MKRIICTLMILGFVSQVFSREPKPYFSWKMIPIEQVFENPPEHICCICSFQTAKFHPLSRYKLFSKNLGDSKKVLYDCIADGEGKLMCCRGNEIFELAKAFQCLNDFPPGEPIEFLLISENKKIEMRIKIVPTPIKIVDEEGRSVSLEMVSPDRMMYQFQLENFKPNEWVSVLSISGDEVITQLAKVSEKGQLTGCIDPGIIGKRKGSAKLHITPISSGKALTLDFDWGM